MITEQDAQHLIQKHMNFASNLGHDKLTLNLGTSWKI